MKDFVLLKVKVCDSVTERVGESVNVLVIVKVFVTLSVKVLVFEKVGEFVNVLVGVEAASGKPLLQYRAVPETPAAAPAPPAAPAETVMPLLE